MSRVAISSDLPPERDGDHVASIVGLIIVVPQKYPGPGRGPVGRCSAIPGRGAVVKQKLVGEEQDVASSDVNLKTDEPNRIWFAHSPFKALIFTLVGAGFAWFSWRFISEEELVRIFFLGFSLLFVVVGMLGVFWRMEVDIDLVGRRVRFRKGLWPAPETSYRLLDEAEVVLTMKYRPSGSKSKSRVPWWFVSLKFSGESKGTRIFASANELDGYRKWEYYAKRLKLDAVDATTEDPQKSAWRNLDENLSARSSEVRPVPRRNPAPPAGSAIELLFNRGRREILLPATGFGLGLVFMLVFGGIFAAMGSAVLLAKAGIIHTAVEGSDAALMIVPPVFILVGLGIMWLGIQGSYSATVIGVENGELFVEYLAFGKRSGRKAIAIAEIESVSLAGDVSSRGRTGGNLSVGGVAIGRRKYRERENAVVVRSDGEILRFGSCLPQADRAWLADACHYAAVKGQLP